MKITKEQRQISEANGIPRSTLYRRLQKGWDVNEAITTPPDPTKQHLQERSESGQLIGRGLGDRIFCFRLPVKDQEKLETAIETQGVTVQEYLENVLLKHLKQG
jgi:hypothetical protein